MSQTILRPVFAGSFLFLLFSNPLFSQKTWTGASSTAWANAANWSPAGIPADADNVTIPNVSGGSNRYPIITADIDRTGTTTINSGATLRNTGAVVGFHGNLTNAGTLNIAGETELFAAATFDNTGTVNLNFGANTFYMGGTLNNNPNGMVKVANSASFSVIGGATLNNNANATVTIGANGFWGNDGAVANLGTIFNNGGDIYNTGSINNAGGTFTNSGIFEGDGNFTGSTFTNPSNGSVGLNFSLDCLTFSNGLTNSGELAFDLGTPGGVPVACTDFDKVTVSGTAVLGGVFSAFLLTAVPNGTVFTVLTATSVSGTFIASSQSLGGGQYAVVSYTPTSVKLTISASPLGIELADFGATAGLGGKNILTWATASETNNRAFDIERGTDGENFRAFGQIMGENRPANYRFIDERPFEKTYYRLRQTDFDGTETFSKIVFVEKKSSPGLQIFPTMAGTELMFTTDGEADFRVFNALGQPVMRGKSDGKLDVSGLGKGAFILAVGAERAVFFRE